MTVPDAPGLSQVVLPDGARLRPMGRQDLAAVARAEAALFGAEAWSPALLRAELAAASGAGADRCYVVVDRAAGERGARTGASGPGYAGLWFGDGGGDADLLTVATLPSARRQGVATAMVTHLLRRARQAGCASVLLEVRVSNTAARELYRRLGFVPVGTRRRYYLAPVEDALVMRADTGAQRGAGSTAPARLAGVAGGVGPVGAESVGMGPSAHGACQVFCVSGVVQRWRVI